MTHVNQASHGPMSRTTAEARGGSLGQIQRDREEAKCGVHNLERNEAAPLELACRR